MVQARVRVSRRVQYLFINLLNYKMMDSLIIEVGHTYGYHGYDVTVLEVFPEEGRAFVEFLEGELEGEQIEVDFEDLAF